MIHIKNPTLALLSGAVLLGAAPLASHAQHIIFTGDAADWTFFYDVDSDLFDVVFRAKATTEATNLTNQADQTRDHASPMDFSFDTLTVKLTGYQSVTANGISYFVSSVGGSSPEPDLGFRTRFGTAFDNFTLTLDAASSTLPGDVAIFQLDEFGLNPTFRLETAVGHLSADWPPQGHSHWHWGFSEPGNYSLVFNMQGELAGGAGLSSIGVTTVNFEVIPEPAAVAALLGLAALGAVLAIRRRRL